MNARVASSRLALLVFLTGALVSQAKISIQVTGDRVNLRATADGESEVVSQVSKGARLFTESLDGEWIPVEAPSGADLWVYGKLVKDGKVAVSKLSVRSGPGINYRPVGHLKQGYTVNVRGSRNDWLKIEAPPTCTLWISRKYVKPTAAPPEKPKPTPAPAVTVARPVAPAPRPPVVTSRVVPIRPSAKPVVAQPVPPRIVTRQRFPEVASSTPGASVRGAASHAIPKAAPSSADLPKSLDPSRLVASKIQGKRVNLSGRLLRSGMVWHRPSRYRLAGLDEQGRTVTTCYVLSTRKDLERLMGADVTLTGKAYWVQGVRHMAVLADGIKTLPTASAPRR